MKKKTNNIKELIDPSVFLSIKEDEADIFELDSCLLLTYNRFDLAFKLFYLNYKNKHSILANDVYLAHINAFSLGKYKEPDNELKNSKEAYLSTFELLFLSISKLGFDAEKSLIPLDSEGSIVNGAHRTAISIYLKKAIYAIKTNIKPSKYNHSFFFERGVPIDFLDIAAREFVKSSNHIYIALLWPVAHDNDKEIINILKNVVYTKEVDLTPTGAHNLLTEVYAGEKWLGNIENNFSGTVGKSSKCFDYKNPLRIVVFQDDDISSVLEKKEAIRNLFNIGKHSIHITDTKQEALLLSNILFNSNSIHFLNNANPNSFKNLHVKLNKFKNFIELNEKNEDSFVIGGSMVLEAYGLRVSDDIDFLTSEEIMLKQELINCHNEYIQLYNSTLEDLIFNPKNHFYFKGLKFVSLNKISEFKRIRNENKDIIDIDLIDAYIENDEESLRKQKQKQKIFLLKQKIKHSPISVGLFILKKLRLYDLVRKIYHKLK